MRDFASTGWAKNRADAGFEPTFEVGIDAVPDDDEEAEVLGRTTDRITGAAAITLGATGIDQTLTRRRREGPREVRPAPFHGPTRGAEGHGGAAVAPGPIVGTGGEWRYHAP